MEFQFNVNEYFKRPIVEIGNTLLPPDFVGDRRALWNTVNKVAEIVNEMGEASAHAQGLNKPITTAERLRQSDQNIYLLIDRDGNNGNGAVTGMLKMGKKGLYVFDREGQHFQVTPPCVLDFYVHEKRQRSGLGKKLFEYMLEKENVKPHNLAIDRPSEKFLNFLKKHYYLQDPIKQMNNYVVFDGFFPESYRKESVEISPMNRTNGLQSTQSPNNQPLYGRYGAPRPPCSMGQIIHNTTAQKNTEPASPNNSKNSHDIIPNQIRPIEQGRNETKGQYSKVQYEKQENLKPQQYPNPTARSNISQKESNNIYNAQQYPYTNTQQLNQFHNQPNAHTNQFDQQPYSEDQIRMFPEKETQFKNTPYDEEKTTQILGNIWPGQEQSQQVYQVAQITSNMPDEQQYHQQFGQNERVRQQTVDSKQNSKYQDIQKHILHQTENGGIQQANDSQIYLQQHMNHQQPIQHKIECYPQDQKAAYQSTTSEGRTIDIVPQQMGTTQPLPQILQSGHQTGNYVYGAPQNFPVSNSMNQQNFQQTAVPNQLTTNENKCQEYMSLQKYQEIPQQYQQIPSQQHQEIQHQHQQIPAPHQQIPQQHQQIPQQHQQIPLQHQQIPQQHQQIPSPPHQQIPQQHQQILIPHEHQQEQQYQPYHQQTPQNYQQIPLQHNLSVIKSPHAQYQKQFPEYMNNQQIYVPQRSAPNVMQYVNQQFPVQTTYSSHQLPSNQVERRMKTQEYQYVQPRTLEKQNQPKQSQEQKQDPKNQLKSETVHSLLQVDSKYFKPNPIQLKQPPNIVARSPTPRNRKEETVASLLNAEQEFFENGLLRNKYRVPIFNERIPLQPNQEQGGYPRQIQVTQRAPKQYIPHTPMLLLPPPQLLHTTRTIPQTSNQQEAYQENIHRNKNQVDHLEHFENRQQYSDQPKAQENLVPVNDHQIEQQFVHLGKFGNQQQSHDHSRSQHLVPVNYKQVEQQLNHLAQFGNQQQLHDQHHMHPINLHAEEKSYHHQPFRSDASDCNYQTQQITAMNPQVQQSEQYEVVAQNQYREHPQFSPMEQNAPHQQNPDIQQKQSTLNPSERRSGEWQPCETEVRNNTSSLLHNERQPQQMSLQYHKATNNLQPVERQADNTQECLGKAIIESKSIDEMSGNAAEYKKEPYHSPATIRQGSYIANNFNPHPEGLTKVLTNNKTKSSDEEISSRRKDISRQYGLNEVDMRKKGYKSAIIKRSTDLQEIDNLEFGYPPQISKKRPAPRNILTMRGR